MNWKTYQTLTKKQKEEYNFRFSNISYIPNSSTTGLTLMLLLMIMTNLILISYLFLQTPSISQYHDQVGSILQQGMQLGYIGIVVLVTLLISYFIPLGITIYNKYKFYKNNNIKTIRWWHKKDGNSKER